MESGINSNELTYTTVFEPAEEGGYVVYVPALPGCVTQGETFEEAQIMVKDAIEGYLVTLAEEGMEIPHEQEPGITAQIKVVVPAV
jgi:predicted RNase H-like HicB family nuclease